MNDTNSKSYYMLMKEKFKSTKRKASTSNPLDLVNIFSHSNGQKANGTSSDRSSVGSYTTSCFVSPLKGRKIKKENRSRSFLKTQSSKKSTNMEPCQQMNFACDFNMEESNSYTNPKIEFQSFKKIPSKRRSSNRRRSRTVEVKQPNGSNKLERNSLSPNINRNHDLAISDENNESNDDLIPVSSSIVRSTVASCSVAKTLDKSIPFIDTHIDSQIQDETNEMGGSNKSEISLNDKPLRNIEVRIYKAKDHLESYVPATIRTTPDSKSLKPMNKMDTIPFIDDSPQQMVRTISKVGRVPGRLSDISEESQLSSPNNNFNQDNIDSQLNKNACSPPKINTSLTSNSQINLSNNSHDERRTSMDSFKLNIIKSPKDIMRSPLSPASQPAIPPDSLGRIFLNFNNETKRVALPDKITTLDTVRALFVCTYSNLLNMNMLSQSNFKIYIQDNISGVFFELDDLRDIKDRTVLKVTQFSNSSINMSNLDTSLKSGHPNNSMCGVHNLRTCESKCCHIGSYHFCAKGCSDEGVQRLSSLGGACTEPCSHDGACHLVHSFNSSNSSPETHYRLPRFHHHVGSLLVDVKQLKLQLKQITQLHSNLNHDFAHSLQLISAAISPFRSMNLNGQYSTRIMLANTNSREVHTLESTTKLMNVHISLANETINGIRDLEPLVEQVRLDVVAKRCKVNLIEVETFASILSQYGSNLSQMQSLICGLQEASNVPEIVENMPQLREFLKTETHNDGSILKKCKKLMGTLLILKKLGAVQAKQAPSTTSPLCQLQNIYPNNQEFTFARNKNNININNGQDINIDNFKVDNCKKRDSFNIKYAENSKFTNSSKLEVLDRPIYSGSEKNILNSNCTNSCVIFQPQNLGSCPNVTLLKNNDIVNCVENCNKILHANTNFEDNTKTKNNDNQQLKLNSYNNGNELEVNLIKSSINSDKYIISESMSKDEFDNLNKLDKINEAFRPRFNPILNSERRKEFFKYKESKYNKSDLNMGEFEVNKNRVDCYPLNAKSDIERNNEEITINGCNNETIEKKHLKCKAIEEEIWSEQEGAENIDHSPYSPFRIISPNKKFRHKKAKNNHTNVEINDENYGQKENTKINLINKQICNNITNSLCYEKEMEETEKENSDKNCNEEIAINKAFCFLKKEENNISETTENCNDFPYFHRSDCNLENQNITYTSQAALNHEKFSDKSGFMKNITLRRKRGPPLPTRKTAASCDFPLSTTLDDHHLTSLIMANEQENNCHDALNGSNDLNNHIVHTTDFLSENKKLENCDFSENNFIAKSELNEYFTKNNIKSIRIINSEQTDIN